MKVTAGLEARTSVVVVGPIVPFVPWGQDDFAPSALLPHVQALMPAVRRLAQHAQLLHEGGHIHKGVVVCLQDEPARQSQCLGVSWAWQKQSEGIQPVSQAGLRQAGLRGKQPSEREMAAEKGVIRAESCRRIELHMLT